MCYQIQLRESASYSYCARSWRQQTNPSRKNNFPLCWKCYKTIGSYVSCAFIEIRSTWEVWRALKKLELLLKFLTTGSRYTFFRYAVSYKRNSNSSWPWMLLQQWTNFLQSTLLKYCFTVYLAMYTGAISGFKTRLFTATRNDLSPHQGLGLV